MEIKFVDCTSTKENAGIHILRSICIPALYRHSLRLQRTFIEFIRVLISSKGVCTYGKGIGGLHFIFDKHLLPVSCSHAAAINSEKQFNDSAFKYTYTFRGWWCEANYPPPPSLHLNFTNFVLQSCIALTLLMTTTCFCSCMCNKSI